MADPAAQADRDLLRCLRWDGEGDSRLRALTPPQWQHLWRMVETGGGQALLARRLQMAGIHPPDDIAAALRRRAMAVAGRALLARQALAAAIGDAGRPALLLKGIDVGERLYGNCGMRPMGDTDILVRQEDIAAYHDVLTAQGYQASQVPDNALIASARLHNLTYTAPRNMPIELHWRLADSGDDDGIDLENIWGRALAHPQIAGAWVMATGDLFLYLCLHLKHHTFDTPLTQLWDLAELLRTLPLDWPQVWTQARAWRLEETVRLALFLLDTQLGVRNDQAMGWLPDPAISRSLPDILAHLGQFPVQDQLAGHRIAILLSRGTGWRERLRVLREGAFASRAEVRALHGRPDDGFARDMLSFLRRWQFLLQGKGRLLRHWLLAERQVTGHIDRIAALRRHLDTKS